MGTEPLAGWREVAVRKTKTKIDWAEEMGRLMEGHYIHYDKVILGSDLILERVWCKKSDDGLTSNFSTKNGSVNAIFRAMASAKNCPSPPTEPTPPRLVSLRRQKLSVLRLIGVWLPQL